MTLFSLAAVLLVWLPVSRAGPDDKGPPRAEEKGPGPEKKDGFRKRPPGSSPFADWTEEERQKFREAMRRAWNEPAVLQARDEVKAATIAYQKAITAAVKRTDPEMVELMERIRETSDSPLKGMLTGPGGPGGRGPGGGRDHREFEALVTEELPNFLADLNEEQREIYRVAREKALNSPEFQEILGKLRETRAADEDLRKKRIELFRKVRQVLHGQMIKADERVKELLPKGTPPNGRRGPDGKGGAGPKKPPSEGKRD